MSDSNWHLGPLPDGPALPVVACSYKDGDAVSVFHFSFPLPSSFSSITWIAG